mmetsp:Transcript_1335/g.2326  ORF Transcript_1335/g.2326 Transcript_1335/m.2326 type:complete len:230 (-) Transcript_1335:1322-2011(-)
MNPLTKSLDEVIHLVVLRAELLDHGGGEVEARAVGAVEDHLKVQPLAVVQLALEVVFHHLAGLGVLHVPEVDLLVDAAGADERCVQLLRVVGGHDHDAVGAVHDAVQHVQQPGKVKLVRRAGPARGVLDSPPAAALAVHQRGHHGQGHVRALVARAGADQRPQAIARLRAGVVIVPVVALCRSLAVNSDLFGDLGLLLLWGIAVCILGLLLPTLSFFFSDGATLGPSIP